VAKDNKRSLDARLEYLAQNRVKEYETATVRYPYTRTDHKKDMGNRIAEMTIRFISYMDNLSGWNPMFLGVIKR